MHKIFVNGASGKMGQSVLKIIKDSDDFAKDNLLNSDVVIDFSNPISTLQILNECVDNKKPLIIGTTGISEDHLDAIKKASKKIPILLAANMSIGINNLKESITIFLNQLEQKMHCIIEETHHVQKIDKPSGTAIELIDLIKLNDKNQNIMNIEVNSNRVEDVFGIHKITFYSKNGSSYFMHEALSRDVFAQGALLSSKIVGGLEPNIYKFKDILN